MAMLRESGQAFGGTLLAIVVSSYFQCPQTIEVRLRNRIGNKGDVEVRYNNRGERKGLKRA